MAMIFELHKSRIKRRNAIQGKMEQQTNIFVEQCLVDNDIYFSNLPQTACLNRKYKYQGNAHRLR